MMMGFSGIDHNLGHEKNKLLEEEVLKLNT